MMDFDIGRDFYADTPMGKDPDERSRKLRETHQLLWSKDLPTRTPIEFTMPRNRSHGFLTYVAQDRSTVVVGSDALTNSYTRWTRPKELFAAKAQLSDDEQARYLNPKYTIGQTIVWPVRTADRPTINQARGTNPAIDDRADLTLECIRRHYAREPNPLSGPLTAYKDWFTLFKDFGGFVEFFFLQDLLDPNLERVAIWKPVTNFTRRGVPMTLADYIAHRESTIEFITKREERIAAWVETQRAITELRQV